MGALPQPPPPRPPGRGVLHVPSPRRAGAKAPRKGPDAPPYPRASRGARGPRPRTTPLLGLLQRGAGRPGLTLAGPAAALAADDLQVRVVGALVLRLRALAGVAAPGQPEGRQRGQPRRPTLPTHPHGSHS